MTLLDPREPVSALSHGIGLLLSLAGLAVLWRMCPRDLGKRLSLLVYGLSMAACFGASALFHAVRGPESVVARFETVDHIGVYLYIAGTYTVVGWGMLRGHWRRCTLGLAWLGALAGGVVKVAAHGISDLASTGCFLAVGWGLAFIYVELARQVSRRDLQPVLLGGLFHSIGAAIKVLGHPDPWPGVVGPHEVFHVLVLAGSLAHYRFVLRVVLPYERDPAEPRVAPYPALRVRLPERMRRPRLGRVSLPAA